MEIPITSYFSLRKPPGGRKRDLDAPNRVFSASKKQKQEKTKRSQERLNYVTSTGQEEISTAPTGPTASSSCTSRQTRSGTGGSRTQIVRTGCPLIPTTSIPQPRNKYKVTSSFQSSPTTKPRAPKRKNTSPPPKAGQSSGLHIPPKIIRSSTSLQLRTSLPQPPQRQLRDHPSNRDEEPPQHDPDEHSIPSSQTQDMFKSCLNDCRRAPSSEIPYRHVQSSSQSGVLTLFNSPDVDSLGRSSYHLINDHQIIFSSQTQFLDPFNQSPRKEGTNKNMADTSQEGPTENIIPSSQSQEWELSLLVDGNVPSYPQQTALHRCVDPLSIAPLVPEN